MSADAPRIPPGTGREVGRFARTVARVGGVVTRTEPTGLFLALGRRPALFRTWLSFASRLMPFGSLPRADTELVILRVAHLAGSDYEFDQHLRIGKRAGLTEADLTGVLAGPEAPHWTDRQRVLLTAVDQLFTDGDLDDGTWLLLRGHLDESHAVEFVLLVGHYQMLATFIRTLRIPVDKRR